MKTKYLLYAIPAMLLVACSSDEPAQSVNADGVAVVTANIGAVTSRASGTQWSANDQIGISGTTGAVKYANVPYITTDGSGNFTARDGVADGIFFQDNKIATFSAYYPYSADVTTDNNIITASTADQSQAATFDFLYAANAKGSLTNPALNFIGNAAFKHSMAQFVINLTADRDGGFSEGIGVVTSNGTISLGGIGLEGEFNTITGVASAKGTASDLQLSNAVVADNSASYSLIFFPQTAENFELRVEYEGSTYSCTFTPTLAAGKRFTANITLRKTGLTVGNAEITDWEDSGSFSGDATIQAI